MNAPAPLTATPPARLDWRAHDQPVARDFEDIYYSTDGGLEECREVFLRACQLPDAWRGKDVFVIGELGFGTGLNFLTTLKLWQETARAGQRLVYISVEGFPLDKDQLIRALSG
ncbi:MAG TPA: FAD-dependent cmnm(5)s(2)U34 oxidoreductase, partial [Hellea balneolensis]|nr:FAD-dependent cmnm(5)s(2)U34 oxidoreductase [Hellea balneolensis]